MKEYAPLLKKEKHNFNLRPAFISSSLPASRIDHIYCEKCHTWHKVRRYKKQSTREYEGKAACYLKVLQARIALDILEHPDDFSSISELEAKYDKEFRRALKQTTKKNQTNFPWVFNEEVYGVRNVFRVYPGLKNWVDDLLDCNQGCIPISLNKKTKEYDFLVIQAKNQIRIYSAKNERAIGEHDVKERYNNWKYRFKCPSCGNYGVVKAGVTVDRYDAFYPVNATIFTMEDGSKSISFTVRYENIIFPKAADNIEDEYQGSPVYNYTTVSGKIIYSANGHTYIKAPIDINTGKQVPWWKIRKNIIDVTYSMDTTSVTNFYHTCLDALEKDGVLPKKYHLINRFRNVSGQLIADLSDGLSWCINNPVSKKFIQQYCRTIDMYDNDLGIVSKITKQYELPQSKKFKKLLMANPYLITVTYTACKYFGFKDINTFYTLFETGSKAAQRRLNNSFAYGGEERLLFADYIRRALKVCAETKLLAHLLDDTMFSDALYALKRAKNEGVLEEDIDRCFKSSLRKTHDSLIETLERYMAMKKKVMAEKAVSKQVLAYKTARMQGQKDMVNITKQEIIRNKLEENQKILYTEEEIGKYEKMINGIKFILPRTTSELIVAGKKLHNCVGSCYRTPALFKTSTIVLMEKDKNLCGCIEVNNNSIRQAYGPCNKKLKDEEQAAFEVWRKTCGIAERMLAPTVPMRIQQPPKELVEKIWAEVVEEYGLHEYEEAA